jgi:polyhydroxybutyrate depolymerase
MPIEKFEPKRPISVLHFHGTKDTLVPYNGPDPKKDSLGIMKFRSVEDTIMACVKANGCSETPNVTAMPLTEDRVKVIRKEYSKGKAGSEVVLYIVEGGGHTWPGSTLSPPFLGLSTNNISANEIMWEFFKKHPLK